MKWCDLWKVLANYQVVASMSILNQRESAETTCLLVFKWGDISAFIQTVLDLLMELFSLSSSISNVIIIIINSEEVFDTTNKVNVSLFHRVKLRSCTSVRNSTNRIWWPDNLNWTEKRINQQWLAGKNNHGWYLIIIKYYVESEYN